jgi:8-oxo-dGTP diphosphatase
MQREFPVQPIVGVGAVVIHDGRALLIRRGGEPLAGEWSIPGGVLELGETLRAGAEREAREETGLIVRAGERLDVFESIVPSPDDRTRYHYVLVDFLCAVEGGELCAGGDAAEVRWATPSELEALDLRPSIRAVLKQAFALTSSE